MWKRKELKTKAKQVIRKNYWTAIVVCFLLAILTGEFGTSIIGMWQSEDSIDPNYITNSISEKENEYLIPFDLSDMQLKIADIVERNLNSITKSEKFLFKIWDAVNLFNLDKNGLGVALCIAAILAIAYEVFVANPLIVGGRKYFLEAREGSNTKIGTMTMAFKKDNWLNIAIIMLIKNVYNILWYLTIIGGFIKFYEYRMIPYILAENPKIIRKEAFRLSKQMMRGNKWKTFILDMSFWLWNLLSVFTFGILNILYVNPYKVATISELYCKLKENITTEND